MIVPGGGISLDRERWVACRSNFFLPVRVLSRLFRRLVLERQSYQSSLKASSRKGILQVVIFLLGTEVLPMRYYFDVRESDEIAVRRRRS